MKNVNKIFSAAAVIAIMTSLAGGGVAVRAAVDVNSVTGIVSCSYAPTDTTVSNAKGTYDLTNGLVLVMPEDDTKRDKNAVYPNGKIATFYSTKINEEVNDTEFNSDNPAPDSYDSFESGYAKYTAPSNGILKFGITGYMGAVLYSNGNISYPSGNTDISVQKGDILIVYRTTKSTSGDRGLETLTFTPDKTDKIYTFSASLSEMEGMKLNVDYTDGNGDAVKTVDLSTETQFSGKGDINLAITFTDVPETTTINSVTIK